MTNETLTVDSVLDLAEAMSNMDGDAELLQEIVEIFQETAEEQLNTLEQCIQIQDTNQVAILAHAMKGGSSNFCARKFVASSLRLELLAKGGSLEGAEEMLAQMRLDNIEISEMIGEINWEEVERNWQG
jgi:HPt (histidine-containing phosphotransfer) domain-containing protein